METIPVDEPGRPASHLAVRFDRPSGDFPLCLLYLHGFGSRQSGEKADFFRSRALASGLAFCSFDFQGHGDSGGSMRELTFSRNLADTGRVYDFLRQRGIERVALVGSSMGGATALWYAALHPGQPEQVVAGLHIAPAVGLEHGLASWAGPERLRRWQEEGVISFSNELVTADLGWELMEDLARYPLADLLPRYRTPTLLLQGKRDESVAWRDVVEFATTCAYDEIELHLFADGDHRLTDRKERLWQLMLGFLADRGLTSLGAPAALPSAR